VKDLHREDHERKIALSIAESLERIDQTLTRIDMALMHQAGVGTIHATPDETNGGAVISFTFNEVPPEPVEMRRAGTTRQLVGTEVWEFIPPPPYTGVSLICAPDDNEPLGMRCYAEVKGPGGMREKYGISWGKV
jgi:hypothetical protein